MLAIQIMLWFICFHFWFLMRPLRPSFIFRVGILWLFLRLCQLQLPPKLLESYRAPFLLLSNLFLCFGNQLVYIYHIIIRTTCHIVSISRRFLFLQLIFTLSWAMPHSTSSRPLVAYLHLQHQHLLPPLSSIQFLNSSLELTVGTQLTLECLLGMEHITWTQLVIVPTLLWLLETLQAMRILLHPSSRKIMSIWQGNRYLFYFWELMFFCSIFSLVL